jgi:CBS domain containing-hemolysin-like protein
MRERGVRYELHSVVRGRTSTHLHLRQRLTGLVLVSLVVDAVGSVLALTFERHAEGTEITNLGDAVFWATTQMLTVSSQLRNPISTGGRIVDVVLELYAITVVAALAGSFAAFFHRRSHERAPVESSTPR